MPGDKTMANLSRSNMTLALALLALPLCFGAMTYKSDETSISRKLASQKPDFAPFVHTMKMSATASLDIEKSNEVVSGAEFSLSSKIDLARELPRTRWEWVVPKGVTALSATSGYIEAGSAEPVVSIRLRHDSKKNEKVRLKLYSEDNKQIAGGTYNTLEQDRIKENLSALKERQLKYTEENPEIRRDDTEPIAGVENY